MVLELLPLNNALARLKEGVVAFSHAPTDTLLRDGVIQRFEFTYELAHKTLKRALETGSASPDWAIWKHYRDLRAKTSHTYKESAALEVIAGIGGFIRDVEFLCSQLEARFA